VFNGASGARPPAAAVSVGFHGVVEFSGVNEFKVFVNDGDFHLSKVLLRNRISLSVAALLLAVLHLFVAQIISLCICRCVTD